MEASGLKDSAYEKLVLESLFAGFPDEGQKAVTAKYPKLADLPNVAMFLDCVRADSTLFPGRKTDWAKWFRSRFKTLGVGIQAASSTAMAKKAVNQPANKGKHPRKDKEKVPCSKERCSSSTHSPEQCYVMHPELRPPLKKAKSSHGHVRAIAAMRKAPAVSLHPVNAKKLAAMTKDMDAIRSSSLDSSLADEIGIVSIKNADFARYFTEFDPIEQAKRLCAFRGPLEDDNRIAVKMFADGYQDQLS
ncbi:hypothetical protein BGZ54_002897 [Gamsiella multidivaricata]|nr:hypothetical protein BGZ54_002897 [Gamsiella multidivaricata]